MTVGYVLLRRIAGPVLMVACAATASTLQAGAQEMGASLSAPMRHDIDAQCDPFGQAPAKSLLLFMRVHGPHASGHWQRNVQGRARGQDSQDDNFQPGTYAQVVMRHGRVGSAKLSEIAANSDVPVTNTYCYAADRLIRMRTEKLVPGTSVTLIRTKYYDGGKLVTHTERTREFGEDVTKSVRLPDTEAVYVRPASLPFYALMTKPRG